MFAYQMKKTLGCHQTWLENPRRNGGNWENHRWTLAMFQPEAYRPTIWTSAVLFPDQGPMGYVDPWRSKSGDPSAVAAFHVKKGRSERPFPARSRHGVGLGGPCGRTLKQGRLNAIELTCSMGSHFIWFIYIYSFIYLFIDLLSHAYTYLHIYTYILPQHTPIVHLFLISTWALFVGLLGLDRLPWPELCHLKPRNLWPFTKLPVS